MKQNKQTLKLIAEGRFDSHEEFYKRYDEIPADERDNNSWWYLHGQLESDCGYDKATAVNCKTAGYSVQTINYKEICDDIVTKVKDSLLIHRMHINGEVPVEIEGIAKKCIGFFWTIDRGKVVYKNKKYPDWMQNGLVCYADDEEACKYARKKMQEIAYII